MTLLAAFLGLSLLVQTDPASTGGAAEPSPPAVAPPAAPPAATTTIRIPAGTPIEIELVDGLSSKTSRIADRFAIRLAEPISIDGKVVLAGGGTGQGEVIDVAAAGINGKQGKLNVSARYLDLDGHRVRIRGMALITTGKSRVDLASNMLLVPYVGMATLFVRGGDIVLPAGTRATARLAEDVEVQVIVTSESGGEVK